MALVLRLLCLQSVESLDLKALEQLTNELAARLTGIRRRQVQKLERELACMTDDISTRDFYLMFVEKLECTVIAYKGQASGMMERSKYSTFWSFLSRPVRRMLGRAQEHVLWYQNCRAF